MKLIRVEHLDGWGMFNKCSDRKTIDEIRHKLAKSLYRRHTTNNPTGGFPPPDIDGLDINEDFKDWYCGFKSIEEFQEWVLPSEVEILIKYDFKIFLIDASEYQIGERQIIFTKESITSKEDVTSLFLTKK